MTPPTRHTFSTPDRSRWLHPEAIGTVVPHQGKPYRVLGAAGPEGHDRTLHQYCIAEEVNPQEIPRWYLVRTRRGKEIVAERTLEAAGITVLLPRLYFQAPRKMPAGGAGPKTRHAAGSNPSSPATSSCSSPPATPTRGTGCGGRRGCKGWWGRDRSRCRCRMRWWTRSWSGLAGSGVIVYREGRPVLAVLYGGSGGTGRTREVGRLLQQPHPAEERVHVLMRIGDQA